MGTLYSQEAYAFWTVHRRRGSLGNDGLTFGVLPRPAPPPLPAGVWGEIPKMLGTVRAKGPGRGMGRAWEHNAGNGRRMGGEWERGAGKQTFAFRKTQLQKLAGAGS